MIQVVVRLMSLAFAGLCLSCASIQPLLPQRPEVSLKNISVSKVSLSEVEFEVALDLKNPNAFALNLAGIDYQIDGLGGLLGEGATVEPLHLAAGKSQHVRLPLRLKTDAAIKFGKAYFSNRKDLPVTFLATVKVDSPAGPLSLNFQNEKDLKAR